MCNDIRCLKQGPYFTRTPKTLLFIAVLTVLLFLLPGHVYSEEVYLGWNANQESDLASNFARSISTDAPLPQTTQSPNPWPHIGRRLVMMLVLLLVAVVVGRKLKSLKPLKPAAKTIWGSD